MRAALCLAMISLVSACALAGDVVQDTVRQEAKLVVNDLVETRFPGLNAAPITDCIIDNATTSEILMLGQAAVVGVTPATSELMVTIASRPATLGCIAQNQSGVFSL